MHFNRSFADALRAAPQFVENSRRTGMTPAITSATASVAAVLLTLTMSVAA